MPEHSEPAFAYEVSAPTATNEAQPLNWETIHQLPQAEVDQHIRDAATRFLAKFEGVDTDNLAQAVTAAQPITMEDFQHLGELEARVRAELPETEASIDVENDLNATPEGRLQLVCQQAGLALEAGQAEQLMAENPKLNGFLRRPLPFANPTLEKKCVGLLSDLLPAVVADPETNSSLTEQTTTENNLDETLNSTPEGRLQMACAQFGLPLEAGQAPSLLSEHPKLNGLLRRPLPFANAVLEEKCQQLLQEILGEPETIAMSSSEEPTSPETTAEPAALSKTKQAIADWARTNQARETQISDQNQTFENVETLEAEKEETHSSQAETIETQTETIENQATAIKDYFKTIEAGNLAHYRAAGTAFLEKEFPDNSRAMEALSDMLDQHEAKLNELQSVFTPSEVQQVFGGSLAQTVTLNLASDAPSVVYQDVFTKIDAGVADQSRRDQLRNQVASRLGIKLNKPPRATDGRDIRKAREAGRGTEPVRDGYEEVTDPETGETVRVPKYKEQKIPYTEDNPYEIRPGVHSYEKAGRPYLKVKVGQNASVAYDVTGWSDEDEAGFAEVAQYAVAFDGIAGVTGFMQNLPGLNYAALKNGAFTPDMIPGALNAVSAFSGAAEGRDGDIDNIDRLRGYFQYIGQVLNPRGTSSDNDEASTNQSLEELGIKQDGVFDQTKLMQAGQLLSDSYWGGGSMTFETLQSQLNPPPTNS